MKIILTRHGQTPWNAETRVQGHTDIPLDARGHAQAEALARRLSRVKLAAIYTSPLSRAHETGAQVAALQGCPVFDDERLIERFFGDWEGQRLTELSKADPALWKAWVETPHDCVVPGAETMEAVFSRSLACANDLRLRHAEDTILVVSHASPVKLLLAYYLGMPPNCVHRMRADNCSYSELRWREERMIVSTLNETLFLQEEGLL